MILFMVLVNDNVLNRSQLWSS